MAAAAPNAPAVAVRKNRSGLVDATPRWHATSTPESECGQEVASPDAALAFGPREGRGNGNGEGVDDRALVHAVKLRVVDLVGVTYSRPGRGKARAVRPDPRMIAGARETLRLDQAPRPGPRASRHPHSEGIEEERAGRDRGRLRKVFVVGSRDVLGEPPDGIPSAHDGGKCIAGGVIRAPLLRNGHGAVTTRTPAAAISERTTIPALQVVRFHAGRSPSRSRRHRWWRPCVAYDGCGQRDPRKRAPAISSGMGVSIAWALVGCLETAMRSPPGLVAAAAIWLFANTAAAQVSGAIWWRKWWTSLRFGASHEDYPEPDW